jgi:hypothetical protein
MNLKAASSLLAVVLLAFACNLHAQDAGLGPNPISANLKGSWESVRDLITKMGDKMPDADYAFKPTPEIQTYGQRMAHVIQFNLRACSQVKGDMPAPLMFSMPPTKAEVMAANKVADDECDSLFSTLTDADLMKTINTGRGGPRLKLAVIEGTLLQHANEVYGYMCVYLRLKGIVPPSSDRNER